MTFTFCAALLCIAEIDQAGIDLAALDVLQNLSDVQAINQPTFELVGELEMLQRLLGIFAGGHAFRFADGDTLNFRIGQFIKARRRGFRGHGDDQHQLVPRDDDCGLIRRAFWTLIRSSTCFRAAEMNRSIGAPFSICAAS